MKNTAFRRVYSLFVGLAALLMLLAVQSAAVSAGETSEETSIEIRFEAVGTEFDLYRVADVSFSDNGEIAFSMTEDFAGAGVAFENFSDEMWQSAAVTLDAYAVTGGLTPMKTAAVAEDGTVSFTGLPLGLYLVRSASTVYGEYRYSATTTILTLPTTTDKPATNLSEWENQISVVPKANKTKIPKEVRHYRIVKQWSGDKKADRPKTITVTITCTAEDPENAGEKKTTSETVELSAENDWSYSWDSEDPSAEYTVDETPVPDGYTRSLKKTEDEEKDLTTFTLTNTYSEKPTVTPTPTPKVPKSVKTGDSSRILTMLLLFVGAGCILLLLLRRSRKER